MSRRPAAVTQSDVARVIRAARQAGAPAVQVCGNVITILLQAPQAPEPGDAFAEWERTYESTKAARRRDGD
jgi:hypothetical protein